MVVVRGMPPNGGFLKEGRALLDTELISLLMASDLFQTLEEGWTQLFVSFSPPAFAVVATGLQAANAATKALPAQIGVVSLHP